MAMINGNGGDNTLNGTADPDDITGGAGNDTILGNGGNDVIDGGGSTLAGSSLFLDWTDQGGDGTDISSGFTQNTGGVNVAVSFTNGGAGDSATVETDQTYIETGEPFDPFSGVGLRGDGGANAWTTTLNFSAISGSGFADTVENITFRLQDIDAGGWQDIVTVNAFDADGNAIEVVLTPTGNDTVSDNTITAGPGATGATDPQGSVLVSIPGPVARIDIIHQNGGTSGQLLYVTDIHFEATPIDDDSITGGDGNDTIFGGFGDDTISGGNDDDVIDGGRGNDDLQGDAGSDTIGGGAGDDQISGGDNDDSLSGGAGRDTLLGGSGADTLSGDTGDDSLVGGDGTDILTGGEGADTLEGGGNNDTIIAGGDDVVSGGETGPNTADELIVNNVASVAFDPLDSENGTVTFNDGSTATFTGIEILTVNGGPDGVIDGTAEDDLIDGDYFDPNLEQVDNNDGINGTVGDEDVIEGGTGDDTIFAGADNDSVTGGPGTLATSDEALSWVAEGGSGTDLSGGFTQDTGLAEITVNFTNNGGLNDAEVNIQDQFVGSGEPFVSNSALAISGTGAANVATIDFSSDAPLTNVSFRLNDIDADGWQDVVTINAFDADGNAVLVNLTPSGDETVSGNTVSGANGNDSPDNPGSSVLAEIPGPITRFEVIYQNGGNQGQIAYLTDVHFTATDTDADQIFGEGGDDTLDGAAGDDTISGGIGEDSILGGAGSDELSGDDGDDSLFGGEGDDRILGGTGEDEVTGGAGSDTIDTGDDADLIFVGSGDVINGGEGGDDNDTLFISDLDATVAFDPMESEAGTVTFGDGSTATFQNIENVVIPCFTPGSIAETMHGPVAVEKLAVGDLVMTRDNGVQPIRWIGHKHLPVATLISNPRLRPILIRQDGLAPSVPNRDMVISPQHRIMIENQAAELWLGEREILVKARHLTHRPGIDTITPKEGVTYIHLLFDRHEIIRVDETWTESFQPGDMVENDDEKEIFAELLELFPDIARREGRKAFASARPTAKHHEAVLIL
ncbi:MAG: Hint domain-containing protein [Pseudomonadota bacterium]